MEGSFASPITPFLKTVQPMIRNRPRYDTLPPQSWHNLLTQIKCNDVGEYPGISMIRIWESQES
jgi:hypothetical protein